MTHQAANINHLWGSLIIEELVRNGLNYFVISPGSRSTPLTVAVAQNPKAKSIICFDERGAAFHAVGYGRATGKPAVLICTSGSAAANYYPAVIEASTDAIPLIVLSADRPPELRHTGANQTIQQFNLYGQYVKWQLELPCPEEKIEPQMVLTTIDQGVYQARKAPKGVVHLNCMFREPLAPTPGYISENYLASLKEWHSHQQPYTQYAASVAQVQTHDLQKLARIINQTQRGVICVGQLKSQAEIEAVNQLINHLNWPVWVDIQSGMRLGHSSPNIIPYYDQLLLKPFSHQTQPIETILQIGNRITSKRFLQLIEKQPPQHYLAVIDDPWRHDPSHSLSSRIEANISLWCEQILPQLKRSENRAWLQQFQEQSQLINQVIEEFLTASEEITEPALSRTISRYIPPEHGLCLASSMPIRDMDMYAVSNHYPVLVAANRGTSGIEGTIASAAGLAAGLNAPVTVLIGDLSCLYDLNSLALLASIEQPLIIIIINNNGGGIFSFLPIAQYSDVFEPYFGVPHQLKFEAAAQMFNINYSRPGTMKQFVNSYQAAIESHSHAIIEVTTERAENYAFHQALQKKIQVALEQLGEKVLVGKIR